MQCVILDLLDNHLVLHKLSSNQVLKKFLQFFSWNSAKNFDKTF